MKKHDENRDLKSFNRIGKVDYSNKTLKASKNAVIGIHLWGKIDYLTKYCGWHFIWDNDVVVVSNEITKPTKQKKNKEPKLTDKTKKKK